MWGEGNLGVGRTGPQGGGWVARKLWALGFGPPGAFSKLPAPSPHPFQGFPANNGPGPAGPGGLGTHPAGGRVGGRVGEAVWLCGEEGPPASPGQ